MKKYFVKILTVFLAVFVTLSFVGCDFIKTIDIDNGTQEIDIDNNDNLNYTTAVLPDSSEKAESINIVTNYTQEQRTDLPYSSAKDVIANTNIQRSVVSIIIQTGTYIASGSGIIVDINRGVEEENVFYILTCHHVISSMGSISVFVGDTNGKFYGDEGYDSENYAFSGTIGGLKENGKIDTTQAVSLVGGDKDSDVALLRLYVKNNNVASNIVKAKIMDGRYGVALAESVIAIGNAEGSHSAWVTTGTIADLFCSALLDEVGNMTLFGIDVNIYPGNSGGGLFNMYGELIGITNGGQTVAYSTEKIPLGINYAIPLKISEDVAIDNGFINIVKQLLGTYSEYNYGYVSNHREKFGFTVSLTTNTDNTVSVVITVVNSGSVAETAGLVVNDVIKKLTIIHGEEQREIDIVDTEEMNAYYVFTTNMATLQMGDTIKIKVERTVTKMYGIRVTTETEEAEVTFSVNQFYFANTGLDEQGNPLV